MAVNVGQRNVPDTPSTQQCYAVDSALDLACHTLKICKNHNIFTDEYVEIRTSIIELATSIHNDSYTANRIRANDNQELWAERNKLQISAIAKCNSMLGYINIAKRIYHLRRNKSEHWVEKVIKTRELLTKWHQSDVKRYSK